jgi:hypothetical protein
MAIGGLLRILCYGDEGLRITGISCLPSLKTCRTLRRVGMILPCGYGQQWFDQVPCVVRQLRTCIAVVLRPLPCHSAYA